MDPINVDFVQKTKRVKRPFIMPQKGYLKIAVNVIITLFAAAIAYYFILPPLNLHAIECYAFIFGILIFYCVLSFLTSSAAINPENRRFFVRQTSVPAVFMGLLVLLIIIGGLASSVLFRADSYKKLLAVENGTFKTDVQEVDFNSVPMLDSESTEKLGDRKLGELEDWVSQFDVDDYYTQINYKNRPVRVTPLRYSSIIKWMYNRDDGLPAYLIIDMVTQNAEVVRLKEGMKYTTAEHFGRYLERVLRFNYPTFMFDEPVFEIDDAGNPYWICPRLVKTIGLFGGTDVAGAVLVNAVTGKCTYYTIDSIRNDSKLEWIDRVYSSDLLMQQYDYYGKYQKGFINSVIGQKGVKVSTEGYNYLAQDDDVFLYTGVTSVTNDQSIVGFVLINQRTKDAHYYSIAGAKEYSAMDSAQGVVQQYGYKATFPLLLNIGGQATYFMALKDSSSLVKQYAMVNVEQYQIVATGTSVAECLKSYTKLLSEQGISVNVDIDETQQEENKNDGKDKLTSVDGVVDEIRTAVKDGESVFYVRLTGSNIYYAFTMADAETVVILNKGDNVTISYKKGASGAIITGKGIEIK